MPRDNTKSRRMILELLHQPDGSLTKYRISKKTETNISWVIHFLKKLGKKKIVKGTKVMNFNALVEYFLALDRIRHMEFHISQPLKYLKKAKRDYLLTTYSAENLVSHHLFPSRVDAYIREKDVKAWKKELFKKGLIGKGNLRLIIANDEYIFRFVQKIKGLDVVSIPLLMIDLKREGGVCIEAYDYLLSRTVRKHGRKQGN